MPHSSSNRFDVFDFIAPPKVDATTSPAPCHDKGRTRGDIGNPQNNTVGHREM
jgi:hypothetical protein